MRPRLSESDYQSYLAWREKQKAKTETTGSNIVGIIGDTHEPFCHKDYRNFCYEVFNTFKVNRVVHIGDEVDNHALSFHKSETEAASASYEAEEAQKAMNEWYKTFHAVDVMVGNHSALPFRQAQATGIPRKFLRTYQEIWEAPKGWQWHVELDIDHVNYSHGIGCSGQMGAMNRALRSRVSSVIGHLHSFGGVNYHASDNDMIFGLNVGCGIDKRALAFTYGRAFVNKPTLGCGIVIDGRIAHFVPMNLGKKYEWVRQ